MPVDLLLSTHIICGGDQGLAAKSDLSSFEEAGYF